MAFKFIHTADWQLGRAFGSFPADLAAELAAARFSAIARVAAIARDHGARHVLVAGDVFDSETLPNEVLRRAMERMADHADIRFVLLPGNHDPATLGGVWDRAQRLGVPTNIAILTEPTPYALADGVMVLPSPLTTKNPGRDPTAWMDSAVTPDGTLRIGLAHGSVQNFGSDGESAVLIARNRAETAGLAYLALGDWHGATRVSAETWYSGTPEPDRFPNNDPGHVLVVSAAKPGNVAVERVKSAEFTWSRCAARVNALTDLTQVEAQMSASGAALGRSLIKLALSGSLSLSEAVELDTWREIWSARLRYLDIDTSALVVRPSASDIDSLGNDGPLVDAARQLTALADDAANPDRAIAALALQRLFGFAAEARREAGI